MKLTQTNSAVPLSSTDNLVSFSSVFWFAAPQLHCFSSLSPLSSALLPASSCFQLHEKTSDKPTVHSLPRTKRLTDKASN